MNLLMKPGAHWLGKLALAVCVPLLALSIVEVAMRVYAHVISQERLILVDDVLGWRLAPNVRRLHQREAQPYSVIINSKGFRDAEHAYDKPPGVFRIVVVGDSIVFGAGGVEPPQRFTEILQASTRSVEVINMGVPAYGTDQEYLSLANEGLRYNPDLVIICAAANDFGESFSTINPWNGRPKGYFSLNGDHLVFHPPAYSIFYQLSRHSYLLGMAYHELSKISHAYDKARWQPHLVLDEKARAATFRQLYLSAAELCQKHGTAFLLVYFPDQGQIDKSTVQQVMDDLAATNGIRTLDLMETIGQANAKRPAYIPHDIHLNEYGHQIAAKALLEYLVNNGFVNVAMAQASQ
jgi:lysophospholipase L1-like esterase